MTERKEHYKLYKAKKLWVTAMLATGIFIGTSVATDPVHAATSTDQSITSTSSASEGGSAASSATSTATSSANSSATSSSASQSAASSASSSDRITVNTSDLLSGNAAQIATSKKQVASGNWTFTSPINFSSEGSTNATSGTLDIIGEKGDVYTLKITGDNLVSQLSQ